MEEIYEHRYELPAGLSTRLETAIRKIEFARQYSLSLLKDLEPADWYWMPSELETHIAWQAGHIAMSEYGLTLFQQRGRRLEDAELMSGKFRKLFMRGTAPKPAPEDNPQPQEILDVLSRVHQQARIEVPKFSDDHLDESLGPPHAAYATKYGALLFAADHEMLHAGQIGLLRRLMGKRPIR